MASSSAMNVAFASLSKPRALLTLATALAFTLTAEAAHADGDETPAPTLSPEAPAVPEPAPPSEPQTPQSCTAAHEDGQRARSQNKLVEARRHFVLCAAEASVCAAPLRADCEKWAAEVLEATPTIVIGAQDRAGRDITNITVAIDGEIVAKELDGKSIAVDPGEHNVVLQRGPERLTQTIVVKERLKAQPVVMKVGGGIDVDGAARDLGGHSVWPWAVVAIGGAVVASGIAVALTAPQLPAGCDSETRECVPLPSETTQAFEQRQDDAGNAVGQTLVGIVVAGTGGLIVAGGLLWHFLEPVEPRRTGLRRRLTPWMGSGAGGIAASGSF
jgi:hypothetical protein